MSFNGITAGTSASAPDMGAKQALEQLYIAWLLLMRLLKQPCDISQAVHVLEDNDHRVEYRVICGG